MWLHSFSNLGSRWGWVVNLTPRRLYSRERDPVPTTQEAGWAAGPVWTGAENLASTGIQPRTVQSEAGRYTDYAILALWVRSILLWNTKHTWWRFKDPTCSGRPKYVCNSGIWLWCSVDGIATRIRAGRYGIRMPVGERDFFVLQYVQTGSGDHPTSCLVGTGVLCLG